MGLPGAFIGYRYRYIALGNDSYDTIEGKTSEGPLQNISWVSRK